MITTVSAMPIKPRTAPPAGSVGRDCVQVGAANQQKRSALFAAID